MCEITSQVQCHNCLKYWTTGIVYCTCGTCLRPPDETRKWNKDRFDVLSIPNYVSKKGPSHGARHGNTERQRIHHAAHVSAKKAKKNGYTSILDRFLSSLRYRESQINIGWDEEFCARYDAIAAEDHSFSLQWHSATDVKMLGCLWPIVQVRTARWRLPRSRQNQRAMIRRVWQKGNTRLHPSEQVRQRPGQPFAQHSEGTERVDPKTGWKWHLSAASSSSSSSWWKSSENGGRHSWDGQWFFFWCQRQSVSLGGKCDSFVSETHAHVALPHTWFFSFGSRLESSSQQESLCLTKQSSSHLAQHVTRALVVVSFTLEQHLIFHIHSSPTFYPTIYPTFIAVHFTWR